MRIEAIPIGKNPPFDVNVVIEVPVGGEPIKYELDKNAGTLVVDRFLYTAMRYPGNYGFIPHTLSDDGDPCDVLVANTRAIVPGAIMSVRAGILAPGDFTPMDFVNFMSCMVSTPCDCSGTGLGSYPTGRSLLGVVHRMRSLLARIC